MPRSENLQDQLAYLIASLNRQYVEELADRLRPEGVSVEQFRILTGLSEHNGQTMGELAKSVFVDAPTLTKIVDRMVAEALVYRAPDLDDRRKIRIYLAPKGTALRGRFGRILGDQQRQIVGRLQANEAAALKDLLRGLIGTRSDE